jgi:hypothetical protein
LHERLGKVVLEGNQDHFSWGSQLVVEQQKDLADNLLAEPVVDRIEVEEDMPLQNQLAKPLTKLYRMLLTPKIS